jgi:hypothetical protein
MSRFEKRYRQIMIDLYGAIAPDAGLQGLDEPHYDVRTDSTLPAALREFYATLGYCYEAVEVFNQFLRPGSFEKKGSKIVFGVENQRVVCWAYDAKNPDTIDPVIYQGVYYRAEGKDKIQWVEETERCAEFLSHSLYWQALSGGLPVQDWTTIPRNNLAKIEGEVPRIWKETNHSLFSAAGGIISVVESDDQCEVGLAARNDERMLELKRICNPA